MSEYYEGEPSGSFVSYFMDVFHAAMLIATANAVNDVIACPAIVHFAILARFTKPTKPPTAPRRPNPHR